MVGVRPGCTSHSPLCDGLSQGIPHSATPGQPNTNGEAKTTKIRRKTASSPHKYCAISYELNSIRNQSKHQDF
jgi:hypothetical protein